jgi:hypothetical protein
MDLGALPVACMNGDRLIDVACHRSMSKCLCLCLDRLGELQQHLAGWERNVNLGGKMLEFSPLVCGPIQIIKLKWCVEMA